MIEKLQKADSGKEIKEKLEFTIHTKVNMNRDFY